MSETAWLSVFVNYLANEKNYSPLTIRGYEKDIRRFFQYLEESGSLPADLTLDYLDVRSYLSWLYDQKYARNSIGRKISSLRSFYQFLLKNGAVKENPFSYLHLHKKAQRLPHFFYEDEMEALFEAARGEGPLDLRNSALLETFYATGLRVSEAVALKVEEIDFETGVVLLHGKGQKDRYVPIGGFALDALEVYFDKCRTPLMAKYQKEHSFVFVSRWGDAITARGIRYVFQKIIERGSLSKELHPHMLRHTFATVMLDNGADLRTVQELLGHASLSSTQIYTHVTTKKMQENYRQFFPRA